MLFLYKNSWSFTTPTKIIEPFFCLDVKDHFSIEFRNANASETQLKSGLLFSH